MTGNNKLEGSPLVLLVDDDATLRLLMEASLTQAGFRVEQVDGGEKLVEAFLRWQPDLVILDVEMPVQDGFVSCTELRSLPSGRQVPVLIVTGLDDVHSIHRAYEVGATDFITKPINWPVLAHRVRYILRASRAISDLSISEQRNRALVSAIPDRIMRVRRDGRCLDSTGSAQQRGAIGRNISTLFAADLVEVFMSNIEVTLREAAQQIFEFSVDEQHGQRHYEARTSISGDDEVLLILRDITEAKRSQEQVRTLAYYDSLTGLPNRSLLREHLAAAVARARRGDMTVAVMFMDLDRFKLVNDSLGHSAGDMLLQEVSARLQQCVRDSDCMAREAPDQGRLVSRLGGDEFMFLLPDMVDAESVARVAQRLLQALAAPFSLLGQEVVIGASIGIAVYPHDGDSVETLTRNADMAMYHAKDQGRNNFQFYSSGMNERASSRLLLESELRKGLEQGQFALFYQPQIALVDGHVVGAECLLRWRHPERGMVAPMEFIPAAEETGLIVPLGRWVLEEACRQARAWLDAGHPPLRIAVNLSAVQFRHPGLLETVRGALASSGLPADSLELEITESVLVGHDARVRETLLGIRELGIHLSVDDFGTGYSSLSYLKRFPLDALKIDRSFVRDVMTSSDDASITSAIVAMAHSLKLVVVAEGVETVAQREFLRARGCQFIQGFLISPPVPAEEFEAMLAASSAGVRRAGG